MNNKKKTISSHCRRYAAKKVKDAARKTFFLKFPRRHKVRPEKEAIYISTSLSMQDMYVHSAVGERQELARETETRLDERQVEAREGGEQLVKTRQGELHGAAVLEDVRANLEETPLPETSINLSYI